VKDREGTDQHLQAIGPVEYKRSPFSLMWQLFDSVEGIGGVDLPASPGLAGSQYSHYDNYVFTRGVLEAQPHLVPTALAMLEAASLRAPAFAPIIHTLTNAMVARGEEEGVERWLNASLGLGTGGHLRPLDCEPDGVMVITVASHEKPALDVLRRSVRAVGLELTVLGMNETWRGLGSKVTLLHAFLSRLPLSHDCRLVVFVDAFDVLVLPPAKDIVPRFKVRVDTDRKVSSERPASHLSQLQSGLIRRLIEPGGGLLPGPGRADRLQRGDRLLPGRRHASPL
jgi:hypothetical protein